MEPAPPPVHQLPDDASPSISPRQSYVRRLVPAQRGRGTSGTMANNGQRSGYSPTATPTDMNINSAATPETPKSSSSSSSGPPSPPTSDLRLALRSYLPILTWLPTYSPSIDLVGDCLAGLTVGLMVVPQAMAYAQIAKLPVLVGLYSALFGCVLYTPVGTARDLNVGPTSVLSLLVFSSYRDTAMQEGAAGLPARLDQAAFLCLYAGLLQLAFGLLRLGKVLDFISHPVISAFTSASALTIASVQTKNLVGITVGATFVDNIGDIIANYRQFRWRDALLGAGCIVVLLALSRLRRYPRRTHFALWLLCTGRNAVVVLGASLLSLGFMLSGSAPFVTIPPIDAGSHLPSLSLSFLHDGAVIRDNFVSFTGSAVAIACIGILEGIAVAKSFAKQNHYAHSLDPSQELIATGFIQSVAAFFQCYPVGGSFSRTAVNSQAGIRTPLGGLVAGLVLLLALLVATPLFRYIPQACLAAVIISAVVSIIDFDIFVTLYRLGEPLPLDAVKSSTVAYAIDFVLVVLAGPVYVPLCLLCRRRQTVAPQAWWDLLTLLVAFWGCLLLSIEWGIAMAVVVSIGLAVQRSGTPAVRRLYWCHGDWHDTLDDADAPVKGAEDDEKAAMLDVAGEEGNWLQQEVLCVRVEGNIMYFSVNTILHQLKLFEQHDFLVATPADTAAASTPTTPALQPLLQADHVGAVPEPAAPLRLMRSRADEAALRELEEGLESMELPAPAEAMASSVRFVLLDCIAVNDCDTSGMHGLETLVRDMRRRADKPAGAPVRVVFVRLRPELEAFLVRAFEHAGLGDQAEVAGWFCRSLAEAMDAVSRWRRADMAAAGGK